MTITNVGHWAASAIKTTTVTAVNIGDLMILSSQTGSNVAGVTAVTGGGVTTWLHPLNATSGGIGQDMWVGVVTSTGSSTLTMTTAATAANTFADVWEMSAGSAVPWSVDTSGSHLNTTTTTQVMPTLTPAGSSEMYFGTFDGLGTGSAPTAGYSLLTTGVAMGMGIWNPSVTGVQTPQCTSANASTLCMALLISYTSTGWFDMFE